MPDLTPAPAAPADLGEIAALLAGQGLPHADLTDAHLETFWVLRQGGALVGSAGLEVFPDGGLLRSLAVSPAARGAGAGRALVAAVEREARRRGLPALYLLTTTAGPYFARLGWTAVPREAVPAGVRGAREFVALCSPSSACLTLPLGGLPLGGLPLGGLPLGG